MIKNNLLRSKKLDRKYIDIIDNINSGNDECTYSRLLWIVDELLWADLQWFSGIKTHIVKHQGNDCDLKIYFLSFNETIISDIIIYGVVDGVHNIEYFDKYDVFLLESLFDVEINANSPIKQTGA